MSQMDADVDFCWPVIVIGSEINAVRYTVENEAHILLNRDPSFHSYQRAQSKADITLEQEWSGLVYNIYNSGSCAFQRDIKTIRVEPNKNFLSVFTKAEKKYTIEYEKLFIFDLENVVGLEHTFHQEIAYYRVLDWFDVKTTGGVIETSVIQDPTTDFVKKIIFFDSTRIDGSRSHKDLVSESFLSASQLNNVEFTDTMAKFKVVSLLGTIGIKNPCLELWKRDIYPVKTNAFKREENICLMEST